MPKDRGFASIFVIAIILLLVITIGILSYIAFFKNSFGKNGTTGSPAVISGNIDLNGVVPAGATISILQKEINNEENFSVIVENLTAKDKQPWLWNNAKAGFSYQIQALLMVNGKAIAESKVVSLTAPATGEELTLNIITPQTNPVPANITGIFDLNGYFPAQTTFNLKVRKANEQSYSDVLTNLSVVDGSSFIWQDAIAGVSYVLKAEAYFNGAKIAESGLLTVSAPASNEVITINSSYVPVIGAPPQDSQSTPIPSSSTTSAISGYINLNGLVPSNSSIVIVARPLGTVPYTVVVSGIQAVDQSFWSWNGASLGQQYEIQAVLKVNGNDFAISNTLPVSPPASNELLTINSSANQPQPSQTPNVSCGNTQNNLWNATVSFNNIPSAAQYWIRIGDANSDNRYMDLRITPSNQPGQTTQQATSAYVLGQGATYFAKFAYSLSGTSSNISDFSPFSYVNQFSCN